MDARNKGLDSIVDRQLGEIQRREEICNWCKGSLHVHDAPHESAKTDDGTWWCGWCVDKYLSNCEPIGGHDELGEPEH